MIEEALLLTNGDELSSNGNIAKLLRFFGVPWREITKAEILAGAGDSLGLLALAAGLVAVFFVARRLRTTQA